MNTTIYLLDQQLTLSFIAKVMLGAEADLPQQSRGVKRFSREWKDWH